MVFNHQICSMLTRTFFELNKAEFKTFEVMNEDFHAVNFQNKHVIVRTWFDLEIKFTVDNWGLEVYVPSTYKDC